MSNTASLPTIYAENPALAARLDASRQELLDLGLRNPLLNFRLSKVQGVAVVQEEAVTVYDVLVRQGKTMYFQGVTDAKANVVRSADSIQFMGGYTYLEAAAEGLSEAELAGKREKFRP